MSGTASRYAIGLPYNPGRATGTYARMPTGGGGGAPNVVPQAPVLGLGSGYAPVEDTGGGTVVAPRVQGADGAAGGGMDATLLASALGILPYLPDAYSTVSGWINGGEQLPTPPPFVSETDAAAMYGAPDFSAFDVAGGADALPTPPAFVSEADAAALGAAPDGFAAMGVEPGDFVSASAPAADAAAGAASAPIGQGMTDALTDLGVTGSLGSIPGLGDLATLGLDAGAGYLGSMMTSEAARGLGRSENAGIGHSIGSSIGGIVGSAVPVLGTMVGSALGGLAGGAIGGAIGAPPTVGRNYSAFGRFGQDGALQWGAMGGDNGGTTEDAQAFANWFGPALQQQAAAQGLRFNPAMAGAEIRVGNYDNYMRNAPTGGGFFYDPIVGNASGSPEISAMRAGTGYGYDMWDGGQPQMAGAFLNSTLADLAARDVFTPTGQGRGIDYWNNTGGAPLGWYSPDTNFADAYAERQGAVGGFYQGLQDRWAGNDALRQAGNFGAIHVDDRTNADWDAVWQAQAPMPTDGG